MINVLNEVKEQYKQDSTDKYYFMVFRDLGKMLTNSNIVSQSLEITESICSAGNFQIGLCESANMSVQVGLDDNVTGDEVAIFQVLNEFEPEITYPIDSPIEISGDGITEIETTYTGDNLIYMSNIPYFNANKYYLIFLRLYYVGDEIYLYTETSNGTDRVLYYMSPNQKQLVNVPAWSNSNTYDLNSRVRYNDRIWQSRTNSNTSTPSLESNAWKDITAYIHVCIPIIGSDMFMYKMALLTKNSLVGSAKLYEIDNPLMPLGLFSISSCKRKDLSEIRTLTGYDRMQDVALATSVYYEDPQDTHITIGELVDDAASTTQIIIGGNLSTNTIAPNVISTVTQDAVFPTGDIYKVRRDETQTIKGSYNVNGTGYNRNQKAEVTGNYEENNSGNYSAVIQKYVKGNYSEDRTGYSRTEHRIVQGSYNANGTGYSRIETMEIRGSFSDAYSNNNGGNSQPHYINAYQTLHLSPSFFLRFVDGDINSSYGRDIKVPMKLKRHQKVNINLNEIHDFYTNNSIIDRTVPKGKEGENVSGITWCYYMGPTIVSISVVYGDKYGSHYTLWLEDGSTQDIFISNYDDRHGSEGNFVVGDPRFVIWQVPVWYKFTENLSGWTLTKAEYHKDDGIKALGTWKIFSEIASNVYTEDEFAILPESDCPWYIYAEYQRTVTYGYNFSVPTGYDATPVQNDYVSDSNSTYKPETQYNAAWIKVNDNKRIKYSNNVVQKYMLRKYKKVVTYGYDYQNIEGWTADTGDTILKTGDYANQIIKANKWANNVNPSVNGNIYRYSEKHYKRTLKYKYNFPNMDSSWGNATQEINGTQKVYPNTISATNRYSQIYSTSNIFTTRIRTYLRTLHFGYSWANMGGWTLGANDYNKSGDEILIRNGNRDTSTPGIVIIELTDIYKVKWRDYTRSVYFAYQETAKITTITYKIPAFDGNLAYVAYVHHPSDFGVYLDEPKIKQSAQSHIDDYESEDKLFHATGVFTIDRQSDVQNAIINLSTVVAEIDETNHTFTVSYISSLSYTGAESGTFNGVNPYFGCISHNKKEEFNTMSIEYGSNSIHTTRRDVIQGFLELHGLFINFDRYGVSTLRNLKTAALYPAENLFPHDDDTLYPMLGMDEYADVSLCKSMYVDDIIHEAFDGVCIVKQNTSASEAGLYPFYYNRMTKKYGIVPSNMPNIGFWEGNNYYTIENNFFFDNFIFTENQLKQICAKIIANLGDLQYFNMTAELKCLPYLEVGDGINVATPDNAYDTIILRRRMKGNTNQMDNIETDFD